MSNAKRILVTGAGGFIGHHLVKGLKAEGAYVRGVDIKAPEYEPTAADDFEIEDLRNYEACHRSVQDIDEVYNLAADMGGIGYIGTSQAQIAHNNSLINLHMLQASRASRVGKFLFSSSACVYNQSLQASTDVYPLCEEAAYPADPEPGYGWEKLYAEQLCMYYRKDHGLDTRVVRFHNVYGPLGTYDGGREKVPAAISRKVALANAGDEIDVWGDGEQTRSFMYVDDCVEGLMRIMASSCSDPLNLGTDRLISVNGLVDLVCEIAGKQLRRRHLLDKPQGVRGRNSDNSRLRKLLDWEPSIPLELGLGRTYQWIAEQVAQRSRRTPRPSLSALHPQPAFEANGADAIGAG
jgi:GDP-D-mannose 3', 5'-epimerase